MTPLVAAAPVAPTDTLDTLKKDLFSEMLKQASSIAIAKGMNSLTPLDQGFTGGLPWIYKNAGNFNSNTFTWLNHVWKYNPNGYLETDGTTFTTAYFNIIQNIIYQLTPADQAKLNAANTANSIILNTVLADYTTQFGPFPATNVTPATKTAYVMSQVLTWAPTGTTLDTLRKSLSPITLLSNAPIGTATLINDLMNYLGATAAVAQIQSLVMISMNEIRAILNNLTPAPAAAGNGWMSCQDENGNTIIVPQLDVSQDVSQIQNAFTGKGSAFSISMSLQKVDSTTSKVSVAGSAGIQIPILDFLTFGLKAKAKYDCFSVDTTTQNCKITMSFDGLTTYTPNPLAYDISNNYGWWAPSLIKDALTNGPTDQGYVFGAAKPKNQFGKNGDFGFIKNLLISNPPTITIEYDVADYTSISKSMGGGVSAELSILGFGLVKGSGSYYKSDVHQNATGKGVIITMAPDLGVSPTPLLLQQAYVIGADMFWPGE